MTKILVVDDDRSVRELLKKVLFKAGYGVIEAQGGGDALEKVMHERPDIIVLDILMPEMGGFEVLKKLKTAPSTESIPVILLTVVPPMKGEQEGLKLGATCYITKPWNPGTVEAAIRVALHEVGGLTDEAMDLHASNALELQKVIIRTGNLRLDQKLGGGIPFGSLTLIEGSSSADKSVLCQHLTCEALLDGYGVAYFTSAHSGEGLGTQMDSIGLDVSGYLQEGKLSVYPIEEPTPGRDPERLMSSLALEIERVPSQYKIIIVDSITSLASMSREKAVMSFFSSCKRLCGSDVMRAVVLAAYFYAFDEEMLNRLQVLCDAHLSLHVEKIEAKVTKMLEVRK